MSDRTKSHWGWGWRDKFGDRQQRRALGAMASALLEVEPSEVRDPVAPSQIELPASRLEIPDGMVPWLTDDRQKRIHHTYGSSFPELWKGFHGDFDAAPDLVAQPRNEQQLRALMEWAGAESVALVPRGGATSVVRGVTPGEEVQHYSGWVSVGLDHFDQIGHIDRPDRLARLGAGCTGPRIEDALRPEGLTLRHFPQSFEFSTLGGWLATRAGGHFATNYTRIDDLVESVRMVTPTGVVDTPQLPSTGAGIDPNALVVGSEGTLGVITSAVMKIRARPVYRAKAVVHFERLDEGIEACRRIAQAHLFPSNCRLLDEREAMFNGVVQEPKHVLLLGFESAEVSVERLVSQALGIATDAGGGCPEGPTTSRRESTSDEASRWRQAFLEAPYLQSRLLSVGIVADTFETSIRWSRFPQLHQDLQKTLGDAMDAQGDGALTLRFTHVYPDGPAPYYTFVFTPDDREDTVEAWRRVRHAAADVIARHRGAVTHHHAVGRLHQPWFVRCRPPAFLQALRALKSQLDPQAVLNPGVLVPNPAASR